MRSRAEVLRSARQVGWKGESNDIRNINRWSNRASENSYHGGKSGESGESRLGAADENHAGNSSFKPGVRREA